MLDFLENVVKMSDIFKSALIGNILDGKITGPEENTGVTDPASDGEMGKAFVHDFFENQTESASAHGT